jgi:hypothetical protein
MFVGEMLATGLAAAADGAVPGGTGRVSTGSPPGAGAGAGAGGGGCNATAAVPTASIETAKAKHLYLLDMLIGRLNRVECLTVRRS